MEIPRSLLDELTGAVNALSEAAQGHAGIALANILGEWDGEDVETLRVLCLAAFEPLSEQYAELAAARAADFYDANRRAQGVADGYVAAVDSRRDPAAFEGAVRAMLDIVVKDGGALDRYRTEVLSRFDSDVRRAANRCVAYNAGRDPRKPRYARVPSGGETCGFCLMLASFGFHYGTEEAASHAHKHCDCRVVPSFGQAAVAGYDPDGMYERYRGCLDAAGGRDGIRADWDAMPADERAAYVMSHGGAEGKAFQNYVDKRVSQEIETRDAGWFATGKLPPVTKERGARPLPKEESASRVLSGHGFSVELMKEANRTGVKTADARLCGSVWEFKIPEAYNAKTVKNQFKKALGKGTPRLLISGAECGASVEDLKVDVLSVFSAGEFGEITEVLLIDEEGGILRMRRSRGTSRHR